MNRDILLISESTSVMAQGKKNFITSDQNLSQNLSLILKLSKSGAYTCLKWLDETQAHLLVHGYSCVNKFLTIFQDCLR